ncbi:hypothetical protein PoB_003309000 [Plakobranchus ocellatus]|uniref:Uncharacterized protein n=1 Tax=Plakobranchus ocellatus TaxID=259542 RepID=A0AAV4AIG9_9GAST|nr:hypothetical protein PoB_003309000 [Plakobranchus ocellatus]
MIAPSTLMENVCRILSAQSNLYKPCTEVGPRGRLKIVGVGEHQICLHFHSQGIYAAPALNMNGYPIPWLYGLEDHRWSEIERELSAAVTCLPFFRIGTKTAVRLMRGSSPLLDGQFNRLSKAPF